MERIDRAAWSIIAWTGDHLGMYLLAYWWLVVSGWTTGVWWPAASWLVWPMTAPAYIALRMVWVCIMEHVRCGR